MVETSPGMDTKSQVSCARCRLPGAHHLVRKEYLCADCFTSYIGSKAVKRMETFKVRGMSAGAKQILVPISFGPSSLTILHMLDRQLEGQIKKTGRVGYELHVLHIDDPVSGASHEADSSDPWTVIQKRYPRHKYHRKNLDEALHLFTDSELASTLGDETSSNLSLSDILTSLPSPTSRSDFILSIHRRLLAQTAQELSCIAIAPGHTSTRLAEMVLSETSKGRGAALSLLVGDAAEMEGVRCIYPARDLMRGEIEVWVKEVEPALGEICAQELSQRNQEMQPSVSAKDTTIDQLMTQYFAGVEANFPSIVANVVRTTARLDVPEAREGQRWCSLCALPLDDDTSGLTGWGGDQAALNLAEASDVSKEEVENQEPSKYCYGCARTLQGSKSVQSRSI